jgi:flavorubredoxin
MITRIDQVAHKIYRISSMIPGELISFNQFLIDDECPTLIHTGMHPMYEAVRKAVGEVLDPARLAYVVVPHFESDECGGMGRFVQGSPEAVLACSETGAMINLSTWDYAGPVKGYRDGDVIDLGEKKLRFLETPHVHHWDSAMVYEETTGSLFPADLFIQPGEQAPVVREKLGMEMCAMYQESGIFAAKEPVISVIDRIEKLAPQWIHPMHGGSLPAEVVPHYIEALRTEPIAYDGRLFGRRILG